MKNYLTLLLLLFLGFTSCIVDSSDDDDMPRPDGARDMTISAEVTRLGVGKTCEGDGSSGVAEVYSRFIFYKKKDWDAPLVPLDSSQWVLHELGRGESVDNPDITLTTQMEVDDANRLVAYLEFYEYDGSGNKDFEKSLYFQLGYQTGQQCWTDKVWGDCHPDSPRGSVGFSVPMEGYHRDGERCYVGYNWRISATPN